MVLPPALSFVNAWYKYPCWSFSGVCLIPGWTCLSQLHVQIRTLTHLRVIGMFRVLTMTPGQRNHPRTKDWDQHRPQIAPTSFMILHKKLMFCTLCRDVKKDNAIAKGTNKFLMSTIERHNIQPKDCLLVLMLQISKKKKFQKKDSKKDCSKQEQAILITMKTVF